METGPCLEVGHPLAAQWDTVAGALRPLPVGTCLNGGNSQGFPASRLNTMLGDTGGQDGSCCPRPHNDQVVRVLGHGLSSDE